MRPRAEKAWASPGIPGMPGHGEGQTFEAAAIVQYLANSLMAWACSRIYRYHYIDDPDTMHIGRMTIHHCLPKRDPPRRGRVNHPEGCQVPRALGTPLQQPDDEAYLITSSDQTLAQPQHTVTTRATTARDAGVNVDTKLITVGMLGKRIYEAIEEQSKQWPADLIVIGTEGRRGFQRLMIGSVAEGLVRISTKPVLLIRGT